ncbi:EVE domain-containing protein [Oceanithermus profundus]
MPEPRFWIGVASRDHVRRGVGEGFAQLNHGKARALERIRAGDGLIYYSPVERFGEREPCQRFTAIGRVVGEVYRVDAGGGFRPHRHDVAFFAEAREVPIRPLLEALDFIHDARRWGYAFRFGHLEIGRDDYGRIARAMLGAPPAF